jgi:hypothetical protein
VEEALEILHHLLQLPVQRSVRPMRSQMLHLRRLPKEFPPHLLCKSPPWMSNTHLPLKRPQASFRNSVIPEKPDPVIQKKLPGKCNYSMNS